MGEIGAQIAALERLTRLEVPGTYFVLSPLLSACAISALMYLRLRDADLLVFCFLPRFPDNRKSIGEPEIT